MARVTFRRPAPSRALGRRILIACEGAKTEVGYFEDIRKTLRMEPNKIIVLKPNGSDPLGIVRAAVDERADRQQQGNWTEGDLAWAVFDGDEHIANNADNWNQALQLARRKSIQLGIFNPSFEYWYLLHYQDQAGHLTRQEAIRKLETHLPDYQKSNVIYRSVLVARTGAAISRAQQVSRVAALNAVSLYGNPCTHVWQLVELLLSLQRESR
jgi:hypothetical protein